MPPWITVRRLFGQPADAVVGRRHHALARWLSVRARTWGAGISPAAGVMPAA